MGGRTFGKGECSCGRRGEEMIDENSVLAFLFWWIRVLLLTALFNTCLFYKFYNYSIN